MDMFDTNVLVQVVPNLKTAQIFLLDRFFPNIVEADSEFVSIDVDIGKRRMSPFVSPLIEGKLVESRRYQTNTFKPAYLKDRRAPDLRKPVRRMIGERIGGELTGAERQMVVGMDGVHGYKETPVPGRIQVEARDSGGLTVGDVGKMTNVTGVWEGANGKTVMGRNMWAVDVQEVDATEGTFTMQFEGPSVEEI